MFTIAPPPAASIAGITSRAHQEHAAHVDGERPVPLLHGHVDDAAGAQPAGVVVQDVDPPGELQSPGDGVRDLGLLGDVGATTPCASMPSPSSSATVGGDARPRRRRSARPARPSPANRCGRRPADAVPRAGDHRDLPREPLRLHHAPPFSHRSPTVRTPPRHARDPPASARPRSARGSAPAARHDRVGEADRQHALLRQLAGELDREPLVAEHHGHDRVLAGQHLEAARSEPRTKPPVFECSVRRRSSELSSRSIAARPAPTIAGATLLENR